MCNVERGEWTAPLLVLRRTPLHRKDRRKPRSFSDRGAISRTAPSGRRPAGRRMRRRLPKRLWRARLQGRRGGISLQPKKKTHPELPVVKGLFAGTKKLTSRHGGLMAPTWIHSIKKMYSFQMESRFKVACAASSQKNGSF